MLHSLTTTRTSTENQNSALAPLAAAISFALTASVAPLAAHAQEAAPSKQSETRQLSKLVAKDTEEEVKVDAVASPKFTQPLLDTPQTITIIPQEIFRQQGTGTLAEALQNTPGITMQLGENGATNAGDSFSMRGVSSSTNIFLDSIRDLGAVTRDTFNIEQVEIAKGAVGADNGRGAISGYINQVSKVPVADDIGSATLSLNSAERVRATTDLNKQFGDNSALRFNAMWQNGDVVGTDVVENNRWGVAPSIAFGLNTPTRVYLFSQHVRYDNIPDGGIPAFGFIGYIPTSSAIAANVGSNPAHVDTENFYGHLSADGKSDDYEDASADMVTLRLEHEFAAGATLRNTSRYGKSKVDRVLTSIGAITAPSTDPATWGVTRSRHSNFQENEILTNQTNMAFTFHTGFIEHDLSSGLEFMRESQYSPGYAGLGTTGVFGTSTYSTTLGIANLYNPDPYFTLPTAYAPYRTGAYTDGQTETYAAYIFDTLKFSEQWQLNASVRFEHYETAYDAVAIANTTGIRTVTDLNKSDNLLSWKTGVVYKPVPNGTIYVNYANSLTPPGSANFTLSGTATNINSPNLDSQEANYIELGTKWEVLGDTLLLNAAAYRTENKNELVLLDSLTQTYVQYGKRRIQGVELSATGNLSKNWQLIGGFAWSDNETVSGTTTGTTATGASARWSPTISATAWSTYHFTKVTVGGGARYMGEQKRVVDNSVFTGLGNIPSYWVADAMISYALNDQLSVQLNVNNLLNKEYLSTLNNGGARLVIGAPRNAQLTANFSF